MKINKLITIVFILFLTVGIGAAVFLPQEKRKNQEAAIKIGAGDDVSGLLMNETVANLKDKYKVSESLESASFQDCCSNTAQWALNAKEINVGFYCNHIAKHTIEANPDVEIYGPVIMNGETIVYKQDWEKASKIGVTQGREQQKSIAAKSYPQIQGFNEISQKGLLYAMEDEQVDAAILDITKAADVAQYPSVPLSATDYISYVLVVDKEFAKTEAFADFIRSYNKAAEQLNDTSYLAKLLKVDEAWAADKNIKFLSLEEGQE